MFGVQSAADGVCQGDGPVLESDTLRVFLISFHPLTARLGRRRITSCHTGALRSRVTNTSVWYG